jgi:hypothetical protein
MAGSQRLWGRGLAKGAEGEWGREGRRGKEGASRHAVRRSHSGCHPWRRLLLTLPPSCWPAAGPCQTQPRVLDAIGPQSSHRSCAPAWPPASGASCSGGRGCPQPTMARAADAASANRTQPGSGETRGFEGAPSKAVVFRQWRKGQARRRRRRRHDARACSYSGGIDGFFLPACCCTAVAGSLPSRVAPHSSKKVWLRPGPPTQHGPAGPGWAQSQPSLAGPPPPPPAPHMTSR